MDARDGVQIGADSATMTAPNAVVEQLCIGDIPIVGGNSAYADIAHVAMYHSALSTANILAKTAILRPTP